MAGRLVSPRWQKTLFNEYKLYLHPPLLLLLYVWQNAITELCPFIPSWWHHLWPCRPRGQLLTYHRHVGSVSSGWWATCMLTLIKNTQTDMSSCWVLSPCQTQPKCVSMCGRMWRFTNMVVYAEISYGYVRHKSYSLRAWWYMLSYGTTRNGCAKCFVHVQHFRYMPVCVLYFRHMLYVCSIHLMYVKCPLNYALK